MRRNTVKAIRITYDAMRIPLPMQQILLDRCKTPGNPPKPGKKLMGDLCPVTQLLRTKASGQKNFFFR